MCSLLHSCFLHPLQNSRCGRASLRPLRLYRGYATSSGESGYVESFGGWNGFFCCVDQEGICFLASRENKLIAVEVFLLSNSYSHGFVCSLFDLVRFK